MSRILQILKFDPKTREHLRTKQFSRFYFIFFTPNNFQIVNRQFSYEVSCRVYILADLTTNA